MADEILINGDVETTADADHDSANAKLESLIQTVFSLEQEKSELSRGKDLAMEMVTKLNHEIRVSGKEKSDMRAEIEKYEADNRALESIAARAAELETEVARLQHDLVSAMSDAQEANEESSELKRVVDELRKKDSEMCTRLDAVEKERDLLLERMNNDAKELKGTKAESEAITIELEKEIKSLKLKNSDQEIKWVKIEEETRGKLDEKDNQIRSLKRTADDLQTVIASNQSDSERSVKEREELKQKIDELEKKLEASHKIFNQVRGKEVENFTPDGMAVDGSIILDEEKSWKALTLQWPTVAAASAGVFATVAVLYLRSRVKGN